MGKKKKSNEEINPDYELIRVMMECSQTKSFIRPYFKDEQKVNDWMDAKNPNLGGSSPWDLILAGRTRKVWLFIKAAREDW